ncbi:MAG: hypothetical protein WAU73_25665 [Candidatus Sulfotelmatobacter sp.]|jgi:hypothetical protein
MRQQQPWGTRTMDSSEIQRFERILKIRLEETMRSLDRLGDETRNIDSDFPSDAADRCVMSVSKEALFHQQEEEELGNGSDWADRQVTLWKAA